MVRLPRLASFAALTLVLGLAPAVSGQTAPWTPKAVGTFSGNVNTNPPCTPATFPNSTTAVANVNNAVTGNQTINLNQLIDLQTLNLGSTGGIFTIAAGTGGTLQFDGASALTVTSGATATISAP